MLTMQNALTRLKADIQLRGLSTNTLESYMRNTKIFLEHCGKPIEELSEIDVRQFLGHLAIERGLSPGTVNCYSSAVRFFFAVTLNRTMNYLQIPRMEAPKKLPQILSRDEASRLISSARNIKHKALMLLAYGSGLRVGEIVRLKHSDINSKSMRILVRGGKGKKDRYTILPQATLFALRKYWAERRPKSPEGYLFPGPRNVGHMTGEGVAQAIDKASSNAGISKKVSPHLLEDGCSLFQIKELLGHSSLSSTTIYLHLANTASGVASPADAIPAAELFEDYTE